jgi:serine/threonine protein kinase
MGNPLKIGSRVGNYRIDERIGEGGMGEVFRARDERLGRQVALKVLSGYLANDRELRLRFIRESKAAAAVDHPNIIPVFEADQHDQQPFIAMRYARGGDVRSQLNKTGVLSPTRAAAIVSAMASALDAAHAAGLVHRDVKPANMLLDSASDPNSHVYLTDFGITTRTSDPDSASGSEKIEGTLGYMAPETLQGLHADGRADQFGLACAAFELLSGAPPFITSDGSDGSTIMARIIGAPTPTLSERRPGLPTAADDVFRRALAKAPADRYLTCGQFAAALSAAVSGAADLNATRAMPARRLDIKLKPTFRFVHEPMPGNEVFSSLGNDDLAAELQERIGHSRGGTFLVTGFRGVGKTTLVMRATDKLRQDGGAASRTLCVTLSVARATTIEQLLFAVVRRVFEALSDSGELDRLPAYTRHALLVAYMRTSLSFKETRSNSSERSAGLDVGIGPGKLVKAVADVAAPKVSMSAKSSKSLATEAAFLAYSETDVEYDLMRIVALLEGTYADQRRFSRWRRWLRMHRQTAITPPSSPLHLIIILDEVDKLTVDDGGLATVEKLMSGIKNILTMSGAHFLVVAGPDLHDRAVRDVARGNGVYESVFGWRLYVPCIWDAPDGLIGDIIDDDSARDLDGVRSLVQYLRFKARGVPRRLLQEVNEFIEWDGNQAWLRVDAKDMKRVDFYARMERILREFTEAGGSTRLFPVAIDEDRWRLGSYFVLDWVLQSEGEFTASELLKEGEEAQFDPLLRISRRSIVRLLDHLVQHGILIVSYDPDESGNLVVSDVAESNEKAYRLIDQVRDQLSGFAVRRESERAARDVSLSMAMETNTILPQAWGGGRMAAPDAARAGEEEPLAQLGQTFRVAARVAVETSEVILANRWAFGKLISQGSVSSVYKGRDIRTGRLVMVKVLRPSLADDDVAVARFRREAELLRRLSHSNVVGFLDALDGPATYAIVTEWLQGPTLEDLVATDGPMPAGEAVAMAQILAGAVDYLASEQIARLDLKPANVVMADRGPVIVDLGVAFSIDRGDSNVLTGTGAFIGTPAYMAPEVIDGRAGPSTDIWGLGLVLYYVLTGGTPWGSGNVHEILRRILTERVDLSDLVISSELRDVLARATARDPDDRFATAGDMRDALLGTPEWRSIASGLDETRVDNALAPWPGASSSPSTAAAPTLWLPLVMSDPPAAAEAAEEAGESEAAPEADQLASPELPAVDAEDL